MKDSPNARTGIYSCIFSFYKPIGHHRTAFDGEIKAIHTALKQLLLHLEKFTKVIIFSDSKSAIGSIRSIEPPSVSQWRLVPV